MPFPPRPTATAALLLLLLLLHPIALCRAKPRHGFRHLGRTRPNHHPHPIPTPPRPDSPAVPPPPPGTPWRHHVFLNFRGPDVRHAFCDHLYYALVQKGIKAFRDDRDLPRGESVTEAIPRAIEESKLSIVVLSRGYASSEYCLDELVKIMLTMKEKGHHPFPVFYNLSPDDVADHQSSGFYKGDFDRHKRRYSYERVESWSHALTSIADIAGWVITTDRSEAEMVENIAKNMLWKVHELGRESSAVPSRQSIRRFETGKKQLMNPFICENRRDDDGDDGMFRICGTIINNGERNISLEKVGVYDHSSTSTTTTTAEEKIGSADSDTSEEEPVVTRQPAASGNSERGQFVPAFRPPAPEGSSHDEPTKAAGDSTSTKPSSVPAMEAAAGTWSPPSDTDTRRQPQNEVGNASSSCNSNNKEEESITVDHHHHHHDAPAASPISDEESAGDQEEEDDDDDDEEKRRLWMSRTCTTTCNNKKNNGHNHQHHPQKSHRKARNQKVLGPLLNQQANQQQLKYIKPEISPQGKKTVRIPKSVAQEEIKKFWDLSLIAQQLSNPSPQTNTTTILNEANILWNISSSSSKGSPTSAWVEVKQVGTTTNGLYIFTFSNQNTRDRVVESSPWCIANATFVMRKWQPNLQLSNLVKERAPAIPVWVRLVGVPVEYMNAEGLSYVASVLGKPLYMDRATARRSQLAFAKVCVEMRLSKEGVSTIVVALGGDDDNGVVVRVFYQWRRCMCTTSLPDCSQDDLI